MLKTPMMTMMARIGIAAALATAVLAAPAVAEDESAALDEVWADAVGGQEPILTDRQFAHLNNLAFQAAVTKVCDGYALDHDAFAAGVAEATSPAPENMSDEHAEEWKAAVLIRFGTVYGLLLAEGNNDTEDFCASAAELRDDPEVAHVWE